MMVAPPASAAAAPALSAASADVAECAAKGSIPS
jgi:hypothetical protein